MSCRMHSGLGVATYASVDPLYGPNCRIKSLASIQWSGGSSSSRALEEVGIMDEHIIEIDQIENGHVALVVPSLQLMVMGRTLEEARAWARSAIG